MQQDTSPTLPSSVQIKAERDNKIIVINNHLASAQISLFGAQVLQFQPHHDQRERLWLSPLTQLDCSEAIRGGAPLCWPWFANQFPQATEKLTKLPGHGFLRSQIWQLSQASETETGTTLSFTCPQTKADGFNYRCNVVLEVLVGATLRITLRVENTDNTSFTFTGALHTYFAVHNIRHVQLHGLSGLYQDKTREMNTFLTPEEYRIHEETDRIHQTTGKSVVISQTDIEAHTHIEQSGHDSMVVWNPWDKAKNIANVPDNGYQEFVCVECAITQGKEVLPGEIHELTQIIN